MKVVIDENLPRRLVAWLADRGCEAAHVTDLGLQGATDRSVWNAAVERDAFVLTRDNDFVELTQLESGGGVIRLSVGNCSTRALLNWLEANWTVIVQRKNAGERVIEQ